jgi:hypothetical protein
VRYQFLIEVELLRVGEESSPANADVVLQRTLDKANPGQVTDAHGVEWLVYNWLVSSISPEAFIEYGHGTKEKRRNPKRPK